MPHHVKVLLDQILKELASQELELPVLPDVAHKIRIQIDDPNLSAGQIVLTISSDPAIAAHIIKIANSATFSGKPKVENVKDAIARIGYRMLRNVVMALTMGKLFESASPTLNNKLKLAWAHSQEVAAISHVLALRKKHLKPDQAMLAGLIHNIGVLPICLYLIKNKTQLSPLQLDELIQRGHTKIGTVLLQHWNFTQDLVDTVANHEDLSRNSGSSIPVDHADCVLLANLLSSHSTKFTAWENVSAIERLGLDIQDCQLFSEKFSQEIEFSANLLGLTNTSRIAPPKGAQPYPFH
jgi:HD-like signal output (HDOD) protein